MDIFTLITYLATGIIYYTKTKHKLGTVLLYLLAPIVWIFFFGFFNFYYTNGHDVDIYYAQTFAGDLYRIYNKSLNYISLFFLDFGFLVIDILLLFYLNNLKINNPKILKLFEILLLIFILCFVVYPPIEGFIFVFFKPNY